MSANEDVVVGAGLAGSLLAILLARMQRRVRVYERLPDMRREPIPAGRSINLALAARGIRALDLAGAMKRVEPLLIPMRGRMLHDVEGRLTFTPYGQREHEVIYSVSRPGLNRILLDMAEEAGAEFAFQHGALALDFRRGCFTLRDEHTGQLHDRPLERVFATDGAGSALRRGLVNELGVLCSEELLKHGYKELTLPPGPDGRHQIDKHALHVWPRGGFMLIALPNVDGSFTVTLFLAHEGEHSFEALQNEAAIERFFTTHFPDALALMPQLITEFLARPVGVMGTVRCHQWAVGDRLLLLGDAAHAITPFHGQGMNCAFEDCRELIELMSDSPDLASAFRAFERSRRVHTDAIADMALENYVEMRDTVRDPKFHLQRALSLELERRHPKRFVPRYSMVMFHDEIPYAVALERGRIQNKILVQLTRFATTLDDVDFTAAARMIEERLPSIGS